MKKKIQKYILFFKNRKQKSITKYISFLFIKNKNRKKKTKMVIKLALICVKNVKFEMELLRLISNYNNNKKKKKVKNKQTNNVI